MTTFNKLTTGDMLPNATIDNSKLKLIDALRVLDFVKSNGEARRLIKGNGAKINDIVINDENYILSIKDFEDSKVKISSGKKKHGILIIK